MKTEFKMEESDYGEIIERITAAADTPLIMLQCGMPESPQEAANKAWCALGDKMGFDGMSVESSSTSRLHFFAEPKVTA